MRYKRVDVERSVSRPVPRKVRRPFRRVFLAICGLVTVVLVSASLAQPAEMIVIGGQLFRIGMSKEEALAKLGICCQLSGADDSFFVQSKSGPPFEVLGAIWFNGGVS